MSSAQNLKEQAGDSQSDILLSDSDSDSEWLMVPKSKFANEENEEEMTPEDPSTVLLVEDPLEETEPSTDSSKPEDLLIPEEQSAVPCTNAAIYENTYNVLMFFEDMAIQLSDNQSSLEIEIDDCSSEGKCRNCKETIDTTGVYFTCDIDMSHQYCADCTRHHLMEYMHYTNIPCPSYRPSGRVCEKENRYGFIHDSAYPVFMGSDYDQWAKDRKFALSYDYPLLPRGPFDFNESMKEYRRNKLAERSWALRENKCEIPDKKRRSKPAKTKQQNADRPESIEGNASPSPQVPPSATRDSSSSSSSVKVSKKRKQSKVTSKKQEILVNGVELLSHSDSSGSAQSQDQLSDSEKYLLNLTRWKREAVVRKQNRIRKRCYIECKMCERPLSRSRAYFHCDNDPSHKYCIACTKHHMENHINYTEIPCPSGSDCRKDGEPFVLQTWAYGVFMRSRLADFMARRECALRENKCEIPGKNGPSEPVMTQDETVDRPVSSEGNDCSANENEPLPPSSHTDCHVDDDEADLQVTDSEATAESDHNEVTTPTEIAETEHFGKDPSPSNYLLRGVNRLFKSFF